MYSLTQKDIDRFWGKVDKVNSVFFYNGTRCWEWTATRNHTGYGRAWVNLGLHVAHRVSYQLSFGEIPKELEVCHFCDNPPCVNPSHLFLGTHKENMNDMKKKGRAVRQIGELNGRCILSDKEVDKLRYLYENKIETQVNLAKRFGISQAQVSSIVRYESRTKHIT